MIEIFQYEFMQNAFLAAFLASIACGIIGSYVVVKRLAFISGGISHATFGGIGLGYLLGINPIYTATPFSLFAALLIGILSKKSKLKEDTAIGIFWALGMALGIIFIGFSKGYTPNLMSYLFGNILTVTREDILIMVLLNLVIISLVFSFYQQLLAVCYDEEYAKTQGLHTLFYYLLLLCLIAITVVSLIRIVGIILVIALLTIPAAIAQIYTHNLKKMMFYAIILGALFTFSGLIISYYLDLASGATIILVAGVCYFISLGIKTFWKKLSSKTTS